MERDRLARLRRLSIFGQAGGLGLVAVILAIYSGELSSLGPAQASFRKEFIRHLADVERGDLDPSHRDFLEAGSRAQIAGERALDRCMIIMGLVVLLFVASAAWAQRIQSKLIEGMPEQAGGLQALSVAGFSLAGIGFVALFALGTWTNAILGGWEELPRESLQAAYLRVRGATRTLRALSVARIAVMSMTLLLGVAIQIYAAVLGFRARRRSLERRFELDAPGENR